MRTRDGLSLTLILILVLPLFGPRGGAQAAEVIYDSTAAQSGLWLPYNAPQGTGVPHLTEIAEQVRLADRRERVVEGVDFWLRQEKGPGTFDATLRFYQAQDGVAPTPAAQIGADVTLSGLDLPGGDSLVHFAVPGLRLPDHVVVSLLIANISPDTMLTGIRLWEDPSVGAHDPYVWMRGPFSGEVFVASPFPPEMGRGGFIIYATPAPGAIGLLAAGLVVLGRTRRRGPIADSTGGDL